MQNLFVDVGLLGAAYLGLIYEFHAHFGCYRRFAHLFDGLGRCLRCCDNATSAHFIMVNAFVLGSYLCWGCYAYY